MSTIRQSVDVRSSIVRAFRRDLYGPLPDRVEPADADLQRERLNDAPSRWYLTGFLAPADEDLETEEDDPSVQEEMELDVGEVDAEGAGGAAGDDQPADTPATRQRFFPSSIGITVLLPRPVTSIDAVITWGDYRTEPPLPSEVLSSGEEGDEAGKKSKGRNVDWVRLPQERRMTVAIPVSGTATHVVRESAAPQRQGGGLELTIHARDFSFETPDGTKADVRVVTVFLVNRRSHIHRRYQDITYIFQPRIELRCEAGLQPRYDLSAMRSDDNDLRVADLHYRDVKEYAVGRNTAAGWEVGETDKVRRAWTDNMPTAEVERVAPNEDKSLTSSVAFGMDDLAVLAANDPGGLVAALKELPTLYRQWIATQKSKPAGFPKRQRETAENLIAGMEAAAERIEHGVGILETNGRARRSFEIMNRAIATAARRRTAGATGDPAALRQPTWRPFQLAFILLNLPGLTDRFHKERDLVDLLFFPTGGGKTEAYLGLAAFTIAYRRMGGSGVLGAGVSVIMRYTLRLLTLDQLSRAAGVVCALELLRDDPSYRDGKGNRILGDWPIEIGLWVGSDASPNRLGGKGKTGDDTAVGRVRAYKGGKSKRAPAPIKACPWCGTAFTPQSFRCTPNETAPTNLEIRCTNVKCEFTGNRALPILTVDQPIYRRLPAFLIATIDKFASLPWVGESGAFFGHVDRFDPAVGFFGAAETGGAALDNGHKLDPPDLIIQDELHLISGPLGTVAGLYETAIDALAQRRIGENIVRPKIVASTATVRRAEAQIQALFDRNRTAVFPPPGIDRGDSFFARTLTSVQSPARLYLGVAAQGRGPKLVFLRALVTLLAAADSERQRDTAAGGSGDTADPYMTALCYFNALRELGGARRIVEDEVRDRVSRYGTDRRRIDPADQPFSDRALRAPIELTSRESTDKVAVAKSRLEATFDLTNESIDVALATNMISVGLDITRLGLMVVQGQPKTAAEYIQATSRVGRVPEKPGLVLTILNLHKPRDRTHFEQFAQFHKTFYRAVEATSITPWAPRALDRALAAVVVTIARHIDTALTEEFSAADWRNSPHTAARVLALIEARAPTNIPGGKTALHDYLDRLAKAWVIVADAQTISGESFQYGKYNSARALLHGSLDPSMPSLSTEHRLFVAERSMRDVEHNAILKVLSPTGGPIANADDLS
jgi:hypothetical protein